jgi:type I restriction enzyme S subunit
MEALMMDTAFKIDKSTWKLVKFGDVVFEPKESCQDIVAEGIKHVVGLEHIDSDDVHLRKSAGTEESTTFTKKFRKGDILFGRRRAYLKKAAQAEFDGICSGDITVFRAKQELSPSLLPFIVHNDKFFDYAVKHSAGGLSPRVKFRDLANYEFLLSPKAEQARLAELLWAMDEVIEKEKKLNQQLQFLKQAQLKEVFEKNNCNKHKVGDISDNLDNIRKPISKEKRIPGCTPYYGASGIVDYVEGYTHNEPILLISEDGENLNSRNLPIAYNIDGKSWINNHAHVLRLNKTSRYLVKEFFNFSDISDFITGGTRPKITKGMLTDMPIYLPKDDVLAICEEKLLTIDLSIDSNNNKLSSSQSLQKSLINQIF